MNFNKLKKRAFLALISFAVLFLLYFLVYIFSPANKVDGLVTIEIQKGIGFRQVNSILAEAGLVRRPFLFHLLALGSQATGRIKAGEYELSRSLSPWEILRKLVRGEVRAFMITVLEDSTVRDVLERLVSYGLVDSGEFMRLAYDQEFLRLLGIEGTSVEGYLFPNTYKLDRTMGSERIIRSMVGEFWKSVTPEMRGQLSRLGFSLTEIVILASMIGKETGYAMEKPYVSAVFHNRLKKGMGSLCNLI
ncbi:MAG: endolytic transglycosylase MltG, partial [Smithellaceae bacterium]|nr:endolytic transglycosylase MltG [Smithellaceae bacterium]